MNESMIDNVAKAIANWQDPNKWDEIIKVHPTDSMSIHADHFRAMARAAIKAMMEPTEEMVKAARETESGFPNNANLRFSQMYRSAMQTALQESPENQDQ